MADVDQFIIYCRTGRVKGHNVFVITDEGIRIRGLGDYAQQFLRPGY